MKVKCIKHSDDILVFKSHYIVYGIRIYISHDNLQKIQKIKMRLLSHIKRWQKIKIIFLKV